MAILSAVFASLTAILAKIGIKGIDSNVGTAIRSIVIMILAWGIVVAQGNIRLLNNISKFSWIFLILSGITTGISWLFYFKALQIGKVATVAAIDKSSMVFTLILAMTLLAEKVSLGGIVGIVFMTVGAIMVAYWG